MAEIPLDEDDFDSAAMAEAMGFSGFGSQRPNNKKRKFNPNADSMAGSSGGPSASDMTGANSAPLGQRRPMKLPAPGSGGPQKGGNADEIDLNEGSDDGGGVGLHGNDAAPRYADEMAGIEPQARIDAIVAGNAHPGVIADHQSHMGGGARRPGPGAHANAHSARPTGLPWWEGAWDPKLIERMIENPWDKLEKQRGLEPRDIWARKDAGGTAVLPAAEQIATQVAVVAGEAGGV